MHNLYYAALLLALIRSTSGLHIRGNWRPNGVDITTDFYKTITRFGFQKTDVLHLNKTRGYIYGNVTSTSVNVQSPSILLILLNYAHFRRVHDVLLSVGTGGSHRHDDYCSSVLSVVSDVAFEARCNQKGTQDVFRHVPCPKGRLCSDEDQPANVFNQSQLTYRIQDMAQARFWYLLFVACYLDQNCTWVAHKDLLNFSIDYDLYLVNGHPDNRSTWDIFDHWHFSDDEKDLGQLSLFALFANLLLFGFQVRAYRLQRTERGRFLLGILLLQVTQLGLRCAHIAKQARDGEGFRWAALLSRDLLGQVADGAIILLLVLIAKGWKVRTNVVRRRQRTMCLFSTLMTLHAIFYFWAIASAEWWLETCIFDVWQGWVVLMVRILCMCWFFVELRHSVKLESNEEKQIFLLHFGSGFLVWFVYLPVIGFFASKVPLMARQVTIEGLTHLANFVVLAVLTHLFYPRSSNRWYFLNPGGWQDDGADEELAAAAGDDDGGDCVDRRRPRRFPVNGFAKTAADGAAEVGGTVVVMDDLENVLRVTDFTKQQQLDF